MLSVTSSFLFYRTEDFLDFIDIIKPPYISPQCADYVDLEFSIHAFEHLEVTVSSDLVLVCICIRYSLVLLLSLIQSYRYGTKYSPQSFFYNRRYNLVSSMKIVCTVGQV